MTYNGRKITKEDQILINIAKKNGITVTPNILTAKNNIAGNSNTNSIKGKEIKLICKDGKSIVLKAKSNTKF